MCCDADVWATKEWSNSETFHRDVYWYIVDQNMHNYPKNENEQKIKYLSMQVIHNKWWVTEQLDPIPDVPFLFL